MFSVGTVVEGKRKNGYTITSEGTKWVVCLVVDKRIVITRFPIPHDYPPFKDITVDAEKFYCGSRRRNEIEFYTVESAGFFPLHQLGKLRNAEYKSLLKKNEDEVFAPSTNLKAGMKARIIGNQYMKGVGEHSFQLGDIVEIVRICRNEDDEIYYKCNLVENIRYSYFVPYWDVQPVADISYAI